MDNIEKYLKESETEANLLSADTRDKQLERIKNLWENYKGEDRIVTSYELLDEIANQPSQKKILSGFPSVDKLTGGFTYEQLIVLSSQEKTGKTSWSLQLVGNIREEEPCCFLFEQSPFEIIRQMKERGQDIPYFVTPLKNIDNKFEWFEKRALEAMIKKGSRFFLIDNVDWLQKEYGYNQRTDEVTKDLLLKLKSFCIRWKVIVMLIAHVKKVPMQQIPQPDDIKDTSAFKQIADTVIILWRKTKEEKIADTKTKAPYRTNETLVWVAENRREGKTGYAQMIFEEGRFVERLWDVGLETSQSFDKEFNRYT